MTATEWKTALQTFSALGNSTVTIDRQRLSFRQVYDEYVDSRYAQALIVRLLGSDPQGTEAETLQQQTAFEVLAMLERERLYREEAPNSEYLAAYCLYWWMAFVRGYRFELEIFRDLEASGIEFVAHDMSDPAERRSAYDLIVLRQLGDIKHTTYFLQGSSWLPLDCDFYITRLYHPPWRRYVRIVILAEPAWRKLDGEVVTAPLAEAAACFPSPVRIAGQGRRLIVVPYDLWKNRVRRRQNEET